MTEEIDKALHRVGAAFVAGLRIPGYELMNLKPGFRQSQTYTTAGEPALLGRWNSRELDEAHLALSRVAGSGLVAEMIGDPDGTYTIHWSRDLPSLPAQIVLDDDFRMPGHERPADREPGTVDTRPTDPAVLAEVEALVGEFIARHHAEGYRPGYTEDEIVAAETRLGVRLPEDLRALYRVIHDDYDESGLLNPFVLVALEKLLEWNAAPHPGYDDEPFDDAVIYDCVPPGRVRRVSSSSGWITFAGDYGMNFGAVDLDPAPLGRSGQVVMHGRDVYAPVYYVAASITDLLRQAVETPEGDQPLPDDPHVYVDTFADLATLPDPAAVQGVWVRSATTARFADFKIFPNLRSLTVQGPAAHADLRLPDGLPVEHLHVEAKQFDHLSFPVTLTSLTLGGNETPLSAADLPDVIRLDLSEATVTDIGALAALSSLRVLTLAGGQWTQLLATGWKPAGLAAVRLGGRAGVGDAARWSEAFGQRSVIHTLTRAVEETVEGV